MTTTYDQPPAGDVHDIGDANNRVGGVYDIGGNNGPTVENVYNPGAENLQMNSNLWSWNQFSCMSKTFIVFLAALFILSCNTNLEMMAAFPLLMVPFGCFAYIYWKKRKAGVGIELDVFVRLYAGGFVPGAFVAIICELVITLVLFFVCFSDQLPGWKKLLQELEDDPDHQKEIMKKFTIERTFGYFVFIFLVAYLVAGLVEETMKYMLNKRIKKKSTSPTRLGGFPVLFFRSCSGLLGDGELGVLLSQPAALCYCYRADVYLHSPPHASRPRHCTQPAAERGIWGVPKLRSNYLEIYRDPRHVRLRAVPGDDLQFRYERLPLINANECGECGDSPIDDGYCCLLRPTGKKEIF